MIAKAMAELPHTHGLHQRLREQSGAPPRSRPQDSWILELAHEVTFADFDAVVAQQVVGRGDVEEELR